MDGKPIFPSIQYSDVCMFCLKNGTNSKKYKIVHQHTLVWFPDEEGLCDLAADVPDFYVCRRYHHSGSAIPELLPSGRKHHHGSEQGILWNVSYQDR